MIVILKYQVKNKFTAIQIVNKPDSFVKILLPPEAENYIFSLMASKLSVSIIGPGRLGGTLALVIGAAGYAVPALGVRRETSVARELAGKLSAELLLPRQAAGRADVVFLCCGDDVIGQVCKDIAEKGGFRKGQFVIHCSGALESDELAAAETSCGCLTGSFHPLQTFPDMEAGLARWAGTHCFVETKYPQVRDFLRELATATGAVPDDILPGMKSTYHAACVMCCNHMTALADVSMRIFGKAGLDYDQSLSAAAPIMRATLENIIKKGPASALTGPVARGDVSTVKKHIDALADCPDLAEVYRVLCNATVELARRGGMITDEKVLVLSRLLNKNEKE